MTLLPWEVEFDNEWGVPDWRDADQYPPSTGLSDKLWRWQFIRRMEDYREAWDRAAPIQYNCHLTREQGDAAKVLAPTSRRFRVSMEAYDNRAKYIGLVRYPIMSYPNPRANVPSILSSIRYVELNYRDRQGGSRASIPRPEPRRESCMIWPWHTNVDFDLTLPLAPQIARAEKLLRQLQDHHGQTAGFLDAVKTEERGRPRNSKWPLYLRVIDARNAGVTFDEIGRTIRTHDARFEDIKVLAKQWHVAAMKVANIGVL